MEAFLSVLKGEKADFVKKEIVSFSPTDSSVWSARPHYNYSFEFLIEGDSLSAERVGSSLTNLGDSLVVGQIEQRVRVHIHTDSPEEVKRTASQFGKFTLVTEDDLLSQQQAFLAQNNTGIVAVSPGPGFTQIFSESGADAVVSFAASKPSVEELKTACQNVEHQSIILFPNDNDILPAALEASRLVSKLVKVLPTKTAPEGIAALLGYDPQIPFTENLRLMEETYSQVKSGAVTRSVRHYETPEFSVRRGDFIGIYEGRIQKKANDAGAVLLDLLTAMVEPQNEAIMIYRGKPARNPESEEIERLITSHFQDIETQWYFGGQLHYHFIIGVI
jgi:dihydroxyacetone kinase-like predicted kinase